MTKCTNADDSIVSKEKKTYSHILRFLSSFFSEQMDDK